MTEPPKLMDVEHFLLGLVCGIIASFGFMVLLHSVLEHCR